MKYFNGTKSELSFSDSKNKNYNCMSYVRYLYSFIIGFTGSKMKSKEVKSQIQKFIIDELKLKINETESYVCHSSEKGIQFLGYYLRYLPFNKITKRSNKLSRSCLRFRDPQKTIVTNKVQLRIPVKPILRLAVDQGYAKTRKDGKTIRASACLKLSSLEDIFIVQKFSSIIRGLIKYYSLANQRSDLWQILALYRKSCALTLANKHKFKTAAKIYKIYGFNLKVSDSVKKTKSVLFYPTTLKTTANIKLDKKPIILVDKKLNPIDIKIVCSWPGCLKVKYLKKYCVKNLFQFDI